MFADKSILVEMAQCRKNDWKGDVSESFLVIFFRTGSGVMNMKKFISQESLEVLEGLFGRKPDAHPARFVIEVVKADSP